MSAQYLLDTNVLVYVHDARDPSKRERARAVLRRVASGQTAAVPAQVLAEFASVALRRLDPPMDAGDVYAQVESLERTFAILPLTPAVVLEAIRGVRDHRLSFYDAQIWAAAKLGQVPVVLSEDFDAGSVLEGVEFLDPFAAGLDPGSL